MERVGPYEVVEELGRGGAAVVFRARLPGEGPDVAVKVLRLGAGAEAERRAARFEVELGVLTRLRHPHLVTVQDVGVHQGLPFLVLELVPGGSLQERLDARGPLPPREAADLVCKVALALDYVHGCGVLHRDLKPENVLLDAAGEPRLTDFGLAHDLDTSQVEQLTRSGLWLGTPGYWPPEQAQGERRRFGPRSDVYGLGATLYALLTGRPPFVGETFLEVLAATVTQPPTPPRSLRPEVDRELDALCLRCLEKAPDDRFGSAAELARALGRYLRGGGGPVAPPRRWTRRAAWSYGAAVVVVAVSAGVLAWRSATARRAEAFRRAYAAARAGTWEDSTGGVARWSRVIALEPELADGWSMRARHRHRLEDTAGALADLAQALALDPGRVHDRLREIAWLRGEERLDEALASCERGLAASPDERQLHLARGEVLADQGRLEESDAAFERALALAPDRTYPLVARARLRLERGDVAGAEADLSRAAARGDWAAVLERSYLRERRGDAAGVVADLTLLIAGHGLPRILGRRAVVDRDGVLHWRRAGARYELGDPAGAAGDLTTALGRPTPALSRPILLRNRGVMRFHTGAYALAVDDFSRALAEGATEPWTVLADRALALERLGRVEEAAEDLRQALLLAPDSDWRQTIQEQLSELAR